MIKSITLLALVLLPLVLNAQTKLPANIFLRTLPNGLDVVIVEDTTVPLVTMVMTFKAGAFTESAKMNGITGLYQRMLTKANKDFATQQALNYYCGGLGMQEAGTTISLEYSNNYFTLPKSNLEPGLKLMNSETRFAKISPAEFEQEKENTINQVAYRASNPYLILDDAMNHHMWGDLYSYKNSAPANEPIRAATTSLLDSVKGKYFYPNNAQLIIAGDVAHNEVFDLVTKIYSDWKPSGFDPFKKWPAPVFKPIPKTDYFIVESSLARTPVILINWQGPDTRNDVNSTYAADVFSYIINQKASKLSNALVRSGLAYAANLNYLTLKNVGPISLMVRPNPLKVKECVAEVKKQMALIYNDDYITDSQIETAKRMLDIKNIKDEEITSNYAHTLSFWWASASINYFIGYNDHLNKVSRADIKTYVNKYIKNRPYCAGLLISPELRQQINPESFFTAN